MIGSLSIPALTAVVALCSILVAIRAIETSRTPQGAVAWAIFILAVPVAGILLYLIFGNVDHRAFQARRHAAEASLASGREDPGGENGEEYQRLPVFERLAGMQARGGNGVDLLIDAEATYAAFDEAIAAAEDYVLVQFYIIRDDGAGRRLKNALIERARAGVSVVILHDAFRGLGLPGGFVRDLRSAGVQVFAQRGPRRPLGRFQINYRNHRKLIIVDGKVAFTGGLNIGDEHLGLDRRYGRWRDTHARIRGPLVAALQKVFVSDCFWASGQDLNRRLNWEPGRDPRDVRGLILSPAPTDPLGTGNLYFCAMAQAARERLWIATPYFVPDSDVLSSLKLAALRGAEVRILVPDKPDHHLPWYAAFAYFDEVREAGCEIWRYEAGFMHQKVVLVDDDLASVGTMNLDIRSGLLNFEQTAILEDRSFVAEVERMLEGDFARSRRMTTHLGQQSAWIRYGAPAARLLAPVL